MTSQCSAYGRFQRALERSNLFEAEMAARELPTLSLTDALEYCDLLGREAPERYERAALRWHARWATEAKARSLAESQFVLSCLQALNGDGRSIALSALRHFVKRVP
jgi:hypothetical protein